jgi:hypothetical protein
VGCTWWQLMQECLCGTRLPVKARHCVHDALFKGRTHYSDSSTSPRVHPDAQHFTVHSHFNTSTFTFCLYLIGIGKLVILYRFPIPIIKFVPTLTLTSHSQIIFAFSDPGLLFFDVLNLTTS